MTRINGETRLLGLLGWPVEHSHSPAMHNAAAAAAGLNFAYVPLPVRPGDLVTAVPALPRLGFHGFNVTVPHKETIRPLLTRISAEAAAIGAVNTVSVTPEGELVGDNTDGRGFLADLQALDVPVAGRDVLILGAGGAARAVLYALGQAGARTAVLARRVAQAEALAADLQPYFPAQAPIAASLAALPTILPGMTAPLIVNCTPVGMHPHEDTSIWSAALPFPAGSFVYDLVYNPAQTALLRQAAAAGCGTANGRGMLVQQGAAAFTLWTGVQPDVAVMDGAIPA